MFRAYGPGPSLWEPLLPAEALVMPGELARVDELLDDAALLEPFRPFSHPDAARKPVPMETFLRLMYLKYRYRLGYESLCREVAGIADKGLAEARRWPPVHAGAYALRAKALRAKPALRWPTSTC
jgi:IS5 family transposase